MAYVERRLRHNADEMHQHSLRLLDSFQLFLYIPVVLPVVLIFVVFVEDLVQLTQTRSTAGTPGYV